MHIHAKIFNFQFSNQWPIVAIQNFVRIQQGAEGLKNRNRQSHAWSPLTEENYDRHLCMKFYVPAFQIFFTSN
jgi:hypothetical protein